MSLITCHSQAGEVIFGFGGGPQFGSDDTHIAGFIDAIVYDYQRSERQLLSIGASVTHATTNSAQGDSSFTAISIFPELKLFSQLWDKEVFFQVRALGPSYISTDTFGSREQAMQFAFQAQVGGGIYLDSQRHYQLRVQYRHFSNANLKQPNDGIDFPLMLSFGVQF
ncbi:acyloxyacyl hydrolase [Vibrio sp. WXL103]|uniref:acyloxyacyl hydrolase n=1 Tax=Vibrio sp. WXL103 TaxID=3450710 RepID=UPI003EC540B4